MWNRELGRRPFLTMVAGISALILAIVLMQSLSHTQVVAQQVVNETQANLILVKTVSASQAGPGDVIDVYRTSCEQRRARCSVDDG